MAKLGEILINKGLLNEPQLLRAIEESKQSGEILGKVLLRLGIVSEAKLLEALSEQLDMHYFKVLSDSLISKDVVKSVPAKYVKRYRFMPLSLTGNVLRIAVSDPLEVWVVEDLKIQLGVDVQRVLSSTQEISSAVRRYYGINADMVDEIVSKNKLSTRTVSEKKGSTTDQMDSDEASVINLVNRILREAVESRATDIHIEVSQSGVDIRYRIDGLLYKVPVPNGIRLLYPAIVSRVKIMSNLDVVERRLPQDGRAVIDVNGKNIDLRVSVIPSLYGENIVIRILPASMMLELDNLGFSDVERKKVDRLLGLSNGITFLTGPTGSGKTTTLYSFLAQVKNQHVKIITIEDPVEYGVDGIMQIQVLSDIGYTFASAFRSILRHDPDIVMVGEVRDKETADLAVRTALTGHQIFSTLHTNSSIGGIIRLLDIGVEPYLIASSVNAFISQRLVRVLCPHCKRELGVNDNVVDIPVFKDTRNFVADGCKECSQRGYIGRTAVYEILELDDDLRGLIMQKASVSEIRMVAEKKGFVSLFEAGKKKVDEGLTTAAEVLRVSSE